MATHKSYQFFKKKPKKQKTVFSILCKTASRGTFWGTKSCRALSLCASTQLITIPGDVKKLRWESIQKTFKRTKKSDKCGKNDALNFISFQES